MASSPPINSALNAAKKKTDWSLSEFQTGIIAAVLAILETEPLIFHTRTAIAFKLPLCKVLREKFF